MFLDFFGKNRNYLIFIFTVSYLAAFTVNALFQGNFEFLYYTVLMTTLIYIVVFVINRRFYLAFFILANLSLLGFLHLAGGNFEIAGQRLYDFYFVPDIIRYDNIVHTYGTFIVTLTLYSLFADFINERIRQRYFIFSMMLVLMSIGVGTINELVEFLAVVFLNASEQVGSYFNNALDLLFNTVGSILGCIVIYYYREKQRLTNDFYAKIKKNN